MQPGDGPVSRLLRAVNESHYAPVRSEWSTYIHELGYKRKTEHDKVSKCVFVRVLSVFSAEADCFAEITTGSKMTTSLLIFVVYH